MTQAATPADPWAAAQATPGAPAAPAVGQEQGGQGGQSSLAGSYAPAPAGPSRLFQQGSVAPSLFNKTHFLGTERTGIITKAPYDKHDQDFNAKLPKYWSTSKVNGKAFTTDPIDGPTGEKNRPVMVTHIEMDTSYRMDQNECLAVGRDAAFAQQDDGKRIYVVGNKWEYKAFRDAIERAIAAGIPLASDEDLVGLRLTSRRSRQQPNPGGNASWDPDIKLERPAA